MTQLLFSFQGRLNRKPYWLTNLAVGVGVIVLVASPSSWSESTISLRRLRRWRFVIILYIPLFWVSLALGAKRLHDRDKSAVVAGPVLCALPESASCDRRPRCEDLGLVLHLVAFAITVWAFVELGCLRGTRGAEPVWPRPAGARGPGPRRRPRGRALTPAHGAG